MRYKIPYIVGNHPSSGWKGAINIHNDAPKTASFYVLITKLSGKNKNVSRTAYTVEPYESLLLVPTDLYDKRQCVEIIGADNLLITALQFGESGITELRVYDFPK